MSIASEIERIEQGILPNWSDLQKLIYIYDTLKTSIMYDPKYKDKQCSGIVINKVIQGEEEKKLDVLFQKVKFY